MRITSKYHKLNRHHLHARLKTASHRFALMVNNYSPDDTEAQNGLLMVTGKVFVPGYTDATVTIVYPKQKRATDQSFYYITPTESTEDMSLAYSDDTFYPRFSECEQAVKDLPEVTVSQYFYDKGIIPDDPSTFTALTGIPLESDLVNDINEITGEDDAYYPPVDSNLQNLITQGILIADNPTVPYYYLTTETPHTVINGIADSHIFVDPNVVASQMSIIVKRSDQHTEYNTSESTGDANGWDLVLTSSFAPDCISTISYDSFSAMDAELQLDRFSELLHKECRRYGFIYCTEIPFPEWVEQYANSFLTLASHEADLSLDDKFDDNYDNDHPWRIQRNKDRSLQYFISSCSSLGIERDAYLIFVTEEGEKYFDAVGLYHIENEDSKPTSPLFTVESLTLQNNSDTPITACLYYDRRSGRIYYLPLPSSLTSTLSTTNNFIQQLESIQASAHDINTLISSLISADSQEQEEVDRPSFADSSWTQSANDPNLWMSPVYSAPEEPSCRYQIVWESTTDQQAVNVTNGENVEYALPYDIYYQTLDGRSYKGFMERTSYVLGGPRNSGDWESLSTDMQKMLLYLNAIDRIANSSPVLSLEDQISLLRTYKKPFLPDLYNPLPDYWALLTGTPCPRSLDDLTNSNQCLRQTLPLEGHYNSMLVWDPESTGYETPLSVQTSDESIASILKGLTWDLVFQDTAYSQQSEYINQIASVFDSTTFGLISDSIANNLTRLLNQTLELSDSESNGNWLDRQEQYMSSLTSIPKSNESTNSQLIYEYAFSEEQVQDDVRVRSTIGSATLRLIFDGDRQEVTPELIATAVYDNTLTLTVQNTRLTKVFSNFIGHGILSGVTNEEDAQHLEYMLTRNDGHFEPTLAILVAGQAEFKPWAVEGALISLVESLENNSDIPWENLKHAGSTSFNLLWYCKQYADDPYVSTALNNCLDSLSDALQNNGCIPAPGSRTLAGSVKSEYYLPVITDIKNMLPAYVQLDLSASKTGTVAYIDDSVLHFTTGNTYVSKVDGGELVTFGDDEQSGFKINDQLKNANNLIAVLSSILSMPIRLLDDEKDDLEDYVSVQQLYSQDYMDQYYPDGLLAHHIIRR